MDVDVQAVHFELKDETRDFIDERIKKIEFASDLIVDLLFTLVREKHEFVEEVKIHFRWGKSNVIKLKSFDLHEGLDKLIDKLEAKVRKEKGKIKEHKDNKDHKDVDL